MRENQDAQKGGSRHYQSTDDPAEGVECPKRAHFIFPHEAQTANHVGSQDGCQAAPYIRSSNNQENSKQPFSNLCP